jgi:hypothetical protein
MFGLQAIDKTYRAVGKRLRLRRGKHWAIIFCSHVATSAPNSRQRKFLRDRRSENDQKGPFDKENGQGGRGYSNNDSYSSSDEQVAKGEAQTSLPEEPQAKTSVGVERSAEGLAQATST